LPPACATPVDPLTSLLRPFRPQPQPRLPQGYSLVGLPLPSAEELNRLRYACGEPARSPERWQRALARSSWAMTVHSPQGLLVGFVRATSDQALNANLWDLGADPRDPHQERILAALLQGALSRLRRELSGCSISLASPPQALASLEALGFVVDPGGIRAMGLVLHAEDPGIPPEADDHHRQGWTGSAHPAGTPQEATSMEGLEPPTLRTGI
jgi:hypothetical protein